MTPLSSNENENQTKNGNVDECNKQLLKNGLGVGGGGCAGVGGGGGGGGGGDKKSHIVEMERAEDGGGGGGDEDLKLHMVETERAEGDGLNSGCKDFSHSQEVTFLNSTGDSDKNMKKRKYSYEMYDGRNRLKFLPSTSSSFRIEKRLKEKTGLNRAGLILALLCIVLTIALFLACFILWPNRADLKRSPICIKPACLRASAEILPKLNLIESQCTDFRNYSCGNWFASNPLPEDRSEWNLKQLLHFRYRQRVHQLLVTETVSALATKSTLSWKLKNFYDSCMNVDNINSEEERPLKKIISSLGGWHVLKEYSATEWDTYKTLTTLHSHYDVSPFFQIAVVSDIVNTKQNVVQIKPPILGLPDTHYYGEDETHSVIKSYLDFIKDIAQLFGATVVDSRQFSRDLFYFEKRIAEILNAPVKNTTTIQQTYERVKIRELNKILFPIPIYDILIATLPYPNLSVESYVLISNIAYFRKLPSLLSTSDNVSLNKYLIWRLVADYVPYLSSNYVETLNLFNKEYLGQNEPISRWEFCTSTLERFTGLALMSMFERRLEDKEEVASVVTNVFSELLNVVKKEFRNMEQSDTQIDLMEKLNSIAIQIGFSPQMIRENYINDYYQNFNAIKNDFFQNVLLGVNFMHENLQKKLRSTEDEFKWLDDMISQPVSVSYNAAANKIIVPSPVLQRSYFDKDYPLTTLYGGLGREIASAFAASLVYNKSYHNRSLSDDVYAVSVSECVLHKNFTQLDVPDKKLFIEYLLGLKYAHQSLKNELKLVERNISPAMDDFDDEELYFIFYAQSLCTVKTRQRMQNEHQFPVSDVMLINTLLAQSPDFINLYSCKDDPRYSSSLCNL